MVSSKSTMPVLDYFLFESLDSQLKVTGSDIENTIQTIIDGVELSGEGKFLIEHRTLLECLKELPEEPITINVDNQRFSVEIIHANGKFNLTGLDPVDYPDIETMKEEETATLNLESHVLVNSIKTVLPFVASDELRPVMNSIYCEVKDGSMFFVASNAHYLAKLIKPNVYFDDIDFMISPKASKIISELAEGKELITLDIGLRNLKASFGDFTVYSRLVEGNYPNYRGVIPTSNTNIALINVSDFKGALRRTTIFANKASSMVVVKTGPGNFTLSAKDIDFNISATENIACEYSGDKFEIGLKAPFLQQCLQTIDSEEMQMAMKDPMGAVLFTPVGDDVQQLTLLLMPMMINA